MSNFFSGFSFPDLSGLLSSGARDAEPYPGYSLGRPYEVKTEDELFWKPTPVTEATASEARGKIQEGCGVGLKLIWDDDVRTLLVGEVMPDSAAARSGRVRVDDIVCEIDGLNVTGQPIDVVESLLRGPEVRPQTTPTCCFLSVLALSCLRTSLSCAQRGRARSSSWS